MSAEYPRMLYRSRELAHRSGAAAALSPSDVAQGRVNAHTHRGMLLDLRTVADDHESIKAAKAGWAAGPDEAVDSGELALRRRQRVEFVVTNWQYWITTFIALASVIASIASASIAWMVFAAAKVPSQPVPSVSTGAASAQSQAFAGSKFAQLLAAGFAPHEIDEWEASERAALRAEGVDELAIHSYFVDGKAARPTAHPR